MLPEVELLGRTVPSYGILTMAGVLLALLYLKIEERHFHEKNADADLAFVYGIVGSFIGAKLLSVLTVLPSITKNWSLLFTDTQFFLQTYIFAGFVFFGGLYGAIAACLLYAKFAKVKFGVLVRRLLPAFALIHAFGRVGCFFTGCCYGTASESLGIVLANSAIAPNDLPLIPVQLYEAALELLLFAVLAVMGRKQARGELMLGLYLSVYGIARFMLEFLRGDYYRGFVGPLSVSQAIAVPTVVWGLMVLTKNIKAVKNTGQAN